MRAESLRAGSSGEPRLAEKEETDRRVPVGAGGSVLASLRTLLDRTAARLAGRTERVCLPPNTSIRRQQPAEPSLDWRSIIEHSRPEQSAAHTADISPVKKVFPGNDNKRKRGVDDKIDRGPKTFKPSSLLDKFNKSSSKLDDSGIELTPPKPKNVDDTETALLQDTPLRNRVDDIEVVTLDLNEEDEDEVRLDLSALADKITLDKEESRGDLLMDNSISEADGCTVGLPNKNSDAAAYTSTPKPGKPAQHNLRFPEEEVIDCF